MEINHGFNSKNVVTMLLFIWLIDYHLYNHSFNGFDLNK